MGRPVCADCAEEGRDGCFKCGLKRPEPMEPLGIVLPVSVTARSMTPQDAARLIKTLRDLLRDARRCIHCGDPAPCHCENDD